MSEIPLLEIIEACHDLLEFLEGGSHLIREIPGDLQPDRVAALRGMPFRGNDLCNVCLGRGLIEQELTDTGNGLAASWWLGEKGKEALAVWRLKQVANVSTVAPARRASKPKTYVLNWREVLAALGRKNNVSERQLIKRLNDDYEGPIRIAGRGAQPKAEKQMLIEWWNHLEILFQDKAGQLEGASLNAKAHYRYGRSGVAAPEIGGGHKVRRRDRKPT